MKFKLNNDGLIPAIIQDYKSREILMLGYMNEKSFQITLDTKKVTFFSRSQNKLWTKGETSGNYLNYISHDIDCDNDTILIQATNLGPTCHLEKYSCFGDEKFSLNKLEKVISIKSKGDSENSYTAKLNQKGIKEIAKKLTEEAGELSISAVTNDGRLLDEAADLMYHYLVLLNFYDKSLNDVVEVLEKRQK
jgi:phosphoribosyl-ATP pyrophosphohydrolase/phosphoribosyl-AMP cyclohydrolase